MPVLARPGFYINIFVVFTDLNEIFSRICILQTSSFMGKTATLIGATGLTGGHLLRLLLDDPYFDVVKILIRRPFYFSHAKLEKKLVDFTDSDSLLVAI